MGSTQLDQLVHTLPSFVNAADPATHPWYGSAALGLAVGAAGVLVGIVGVLVGVLTWRWSIRQVRNAETTAQQVEMAVAGDRKRSARFLLLKVPDQLVAVERDLATAVETPTPSDRAAARDALTSLRSIAAEAAQLLDPADLTLRDDDRGQFSVLLLLIDLALGDLHDASISVSAATARVPIQLSSATTAALRIAVTITTAP